MDSKPETNRTDGSRAGCDVPDSGRDSRDDILSKDPNVWKKISYDADGPWTNWMWAKFLITLGAMAAILLVMLCVIIRLVF